MEARGLWTDDREDPHGAETGPPDGRDSCAARTIAEAPRQGARDPSTKRGSPPGAWRPGRGTTCSTDAWGRVPDPPPLNGPDREGLPGETPPWAEGRGQLSHLTLALIDGGEETSLFHSYHHMTGDIDSVDTKKISKENTNYD
ncbi:hypothetical protein STEG23_009448 [Scotinomys teguina]